MCPLLVVHMNEKKKKKKKKERRRRRRRREREREREKGNARNYIFIPQLSYNADVVVLINHCINPC
jgi:hypothetical protein